MNAEEFNQHYLSKGNVPIEYIDFRGNKVFAHTDGDAWQCEESGETLVLAITYRILPVSEITVKGYGETI